ncbi:hypothetical protein ACTFIW_008266 [Dictyostelium discoideum]
MRRFWSFRKIFDQSIQTICIQVNVASSLCRLHQCICRTSDPPSQRLFSTKQQQQQQQQQSLNSVNGNSIHYISFIKATKCTYSYTKIFDTINTNKKKDIIYLFIETNYKDEYYIISKEIINSI